MSENVEYAACPHCGKPTAVDVADRPPWPEFGSEGASVCEHCGARFRYRIRLTLDTWSEDKP